MGHYMANEKGSTFFIDVLKIALGVFIGGLLASLAYTKIISLGVEYAAAETAAKIERDLQKMKAEDDQRRVQQETRKRAEQEAAQQQALERQRLALLQQQEREAQAAFAARREAAWRRSFRPAQLCIDDPLTTECIDTANISRRRFEAQYRE